MACLSAAAPCCTRPRAALRLQQQQQPARVQNVHRQQGSCVAAAAARRNWRRRAVGGDTTDSAAADASNGSSESSSSSHLGLVIECDGALLDAHVDGPRVAFNRAFAEIGHDCTNWSPMVGAGGLPGGIGRRWRGWEDAPPCSPQLMHFHPALIHRRSLQVFYDLMRLGDGTGEGVIAAFYAIRGWPHMLPSSERGAFLRNVHSLKVRCAVLRCDVGVVGHCCSSSRWIKQTTIHPPSHLPPNPPPGAHPA